MHCVRSVSLSEFPSQSAAFGMYKSRWEGKSCLGTQAFRPSCTAVVNCCIVYLSCSSHSKVELWTSITFSVCTWAFDWFGLGIGWQWQLARQSTSGFGSVTIYQFGCCFSICGSRWKYGQSQVEMPLRRPVMPYVRVPRTCAIPIIPVISKGEAMIVRDLGNLLCLQSGCRQI